MFYTYVLRSKKNGRLYIGHTNDIERRLLEHNNSKTKSIRYMTPFEIIYKEEYDCNLEASRRERFLKTGRGRQQLKNVMERADS